VLWHEWQNQERELVSTRVTARGGSTVTDADEVVYLVDDDSRVREALSEHLTSLGMDVVSFGTAAEYLAHIRSDQAACLILDLQLPDVNGLDLQRQLSCDASPQIVFISGHGDIPSSVKAIKAGAVEFLTKPVNPEALVRAIRAAFVRDRALRQQQAELARLHARFSLLTPREREVLPLVVGGLLNKQAAAVLGISEVTLQVHRSQIMRKMQSESLADLVRMAARLGIREFGGPQ
jgi:FixJ family two-component response regulator